ncbi:class I SAM-dependent methyltransferase [Azospirillum brasilense]|uniref:class I SAM-dependent methyltransferase n=1 Tax=Azospirillum brasilense TaxID=192 RepID=UPI001EDBF0E3|nr:class I SAM-dependent methyltransferase [Azospirillum brasilense]UKJ78095.1 class I SAM-dependent methyltransferase [Azospirillum brasilense]
MSRRPFLDRVAAYYSDRLATHGPTARGADWRDECSQELRFARLLDLVGTDNRGSIAELGCGYGALAAFLRRNGRPNPYHGVDIAPDMVRAARETHGGLADVVFEESDAPPPADYVVASGIFNVRFDIPDQEWLGFVQETVAAMAAQARRGIAFNVLTAHSDRDRMDPRLYYASPAELLDWCIRRFGRHVALRHDYGLYEFTLLVRHTPEERP